MSNIFAEVSPNPLPIEISNNNTEKKKPILILKNITKKYLLYKFLINTKSVLLAKNPTAFIKPSQSLSIEINILNNNLPLEEYNKTKLLIMFVKSDEEIRSIDQAKKMFKKIKKENSEETEIQEVLVNLNIIYEENDTNLEQNSDIENKEDEKITYINYAQLKTELNLKNNEVIKNLEIQRKRLETLVSQDKKYNNNIKNQGKRKKYYNMDNLILVFIIFIGLIIGANFACGYNRVFKK